MPRTSLPEVRNEISDGEVFDVDLHAMVPYHHVDNSFVLEASYDSKPPPFKGDHHTAYNWGHQGGTILSDSPMIFHDYWDNPIDHLTSNYDINRTEYLSKYRVPFSSSIVRGVDVENAQNEAITAALNSLKGASSNWGNDLGEMRNSVEAIARDAQRAATFIRCMRRGQWGAAADALGISLRSFSHSSNRGRALADYWLGYVYGWRPLAQSMYDTQAVMSDIVNRTSNRVEGTGTGHASGDVTGPYYEKISLDGKWLGSCKCTLKATISNYNLFNLNKVGLTNPISIAWELVPFSFCVDWFLPIGNTLSALTGTQGLDFQGGYFSTITRETINMHRETGRINDYTTCVDGGSYSESQFRFQRVALTEFPQSRFYADLTPFSTPRAVNALALVRQLT